MGVPHHLLFSPASPPLFSPEWFTTYWTYNMYLKNMCTCKYLIRYNMYIVHVALVDVKNICGHGNELKRTREMN
ncbi:unnamed protein product [Brassica oleracea]